MNLSAINNAIEQFHSKIKREKLSPIDWLYTKQYVLQQNPLETQGQFEEWMQELFHSERTQRYWQREDVRSKELMLSFMAYNVDMVRTCFKDLFDEGRDLEGRIDRFKFYMEELVSQVRRSQSIKESFHHQDNAMISFYLMMRYPEKYVYYTRPLHESLVARVEAKPLGQGEDMVRYMKMAKTVGTFIQKDSALLTAHRQRFQQDICDPTLLLVYELLMD